MVGAHLKSLVSPHHDADFLALLVLEEAHVSRAPLLPLLALSIEAEELSASGELKSVTAE